MIVRLEYPQPPGVRGTFDRVSEAVGHAAPGQPGPLTTGEPSVTVPCRPSRLNNMIVERAIVPGDIDIWLGLE